MAARPTPPVPDVDPTLAESTAGTSGRKRRSGTQTRARILDVALELFVDQGYEKTSIRDIAERLGVTKAALYYHFARKEDIFIELHLQMHEIMGSALSRLEELPNDQARADAWPSVVDSLIDLTFEHPQLVLLHLRNTGALAAFLQDERNQNENDDFQQRARTLLQSSDIPLDQRVRIVCSFGAALAALAATDDVFGATDLGELAGSVRAAVARILGGEGSPPTALRSDEGEAAPRLAP